MAKAKNERNQQFIRAWKEEGLSDKQLQKRFGLSEGGMRGLKTRLRKKDPSLYKGQAKEKITESSSQVTSTTPQTSTKRMTFWLEEEMIEKIKNLATKQKRTASQIARELFSKHF
jgi:transposase